MVEFFCPIPIAHIHDIIICAATCLRRDDVLGSIDQRPPCCTRPTEYIPLGGAREAQHEAVFGSRNGWVCTGSTNGSSSYCTWVISRMDVRYVRPYINWILSTQNTAEHFTHFFSCVYPDSFFAKKTMPEVSVRFSWIDVFFVDEVSKKNTEPLRN